MLELAKELLFPRRCPVCDAVTFPFGALCCQKCTGKFLYLGEHYCMKCGKGLSASEQEYCSDCRKYVHLFERGRSLYRYESAAGALFRFKYQNRQEYAEFFGEELYRYLGSDLAAMQAQALIPVPLHKKRYQERGYNQAALLAQALGKCCGIEVLENLVVREKKNSAAEAIKLCRTPKKFEKGF